MQVTIYVRIVFLKVGEIDTLRDRFAADAFIQAKWREPAMDGKLRLVRIIASMFLDSLIAVRHQVCSSNQS
jgi:hypothetical protein